MDDRELFKYVFGREPATETFTYTPEPPRCICGAPLSYSSDLGDTKAGGPPLLTVTVTHPDPVCAEFGPMFRRLYCPSEAPQS